MARQNQWGGRGAEWRDLAWAAAGAASIAFVLAVSVAVVWLLGRAPSQAPAVSQSISSTPTPRALVFERHTPSPPAASVVVAADIVSDTAAPVSTPQMLAVGAADSSGDGGRGPAFEASSAAEFSRLASGSWSVTDDRLVNDGSNPVAEPWLRLAPVSGGSFALEAEIRVETLLETVCDQSFGLAGGDPGTGIVYGAGLFFPCGNDGPVARLSDVAIWEDGYNVDPLFAEKPFDPGQEWHTYRFEVRGERIRLIVDGVGVVSAVAPAGLDPATTGAEAGIWSQGAAIEVRRARIFALPPA